MTDMVIDFLAVNYARVAVPVDKYNPKEGKEYKADFAIDKATMQAIKKQYPNMKKKINPIDSEEYVERYKTEEAPADLVYILKLTVPVEVRYKDKKTGEPKILTKTPPKAYLKEKGAKKAIDITNSRLIGNGSVGKVVLKHRVSESEEYGTSDVLELGDILVTNLIEFEGSGGDGGFNQGPDGAELFGLDDIEVEEGNIGKGNQNTVRNDTDVEGADTDGDQTPPDSDDQY